MRHEPQRRRKRAVFRPAPFLARVLARGQAMAMGVVVLTACAEMGARGAGWTVRDSAGILIVENEHTRPRWRPAEAWRLSAAPAVRIGSVSGASTQLLYRVVHSRKLRDGRIAVVNSGTAEVRLYDADGRYTGRIGGRGAGPGEFRSPWAVHQIRGDSLLIIDLYREISIFDVNGQFARRFLPERPGGQNLGEGFEPVDQFDDGTLLFRRHYREDPSRRGLARSRITMVRTALDGAFAGSFGDFDDQTVLYGGGGDYVFGAWAKEAAADTTMWYGPGDRFELREVTFDGRLRRLLRLDRPLTPVTESDISLYRTTVLEEVRGTSSEQFMNRRVAESQFATHFPAHYDVRTDALGNLWVQDYRPFWERVERVWSVFDESGRYLGDVVVPAGLYIHEIGDDYVLGHWTDELDVEYIVMYRLEKPGR